MRVALLTYSTRPRGGVVHTLALAEALAAIGHDISVVTLGRGGDDAFFRAVDPAVTVQVVPFTARDDESVGDRIIRSIEVLRDGFDPTGFDIVHAQDCISANAAGRCIRTVHHLDTFTTPALAACHEKAVVNPSALVCVSTAVAEEVRHGWGRLATVIPNGVDSARFSAAAAPDAEADRADWTDRFGQYVLAVGGIEPRKGSIDLLEAFALLGRPDARLVFAGGETLFDYSDYRAAFHRRSDELGVRAEILGVVPDADLPALVAASSALSFVSTKEGFGLAAMEALAAGVPVIARELPVLREVFGDAVTYAADPPSIALALGAALDGDSPDPAVGRSLAESYTWETAAHAHVELYAVMLHRPEAAIRQPASWSAST